MEYRNLFYVTKNDHLRGSIISCKRVNEPANLDYAIPIIPEISSMFKNPHLDLSYLKITTQSDFIMGAYRYQTFASDS
jgi:hypothetical protein